MADELKPKVFPESDMPDWSIVTMMIVFGVIIYGGLGFGLYVAVTVVIEMLAR